METLTKELKEHLIEALNLEGMTSDDIGDHTPLFGNGTAETPGLGLDSIDVLELIILLEKHYGVRIANPQEGKEVFRDISTIADYVKTHRKQ